MTVSKITNAPTQKELIDKTNEIIDNLGGGGGTVDQTYDPTSTNAQSGVAVAEAITNNCELTSNKVTSITSSSTDTQYPSAKSVIALLKTIYPVGCVYLTTNSTCPLSALFGTWSLVSSGRALWTGTGSNGGNTISAGLPNITGSATETGNQWGSASGAIQLEARGKVYAHSSNSGTGERGFNINASRSSSIYGNSSTVQPPAYVVNVFRRTA